MHMGTTQNLVEVVAALPVHPHAHGDNVGRQEPGRQRVRFTPMHMGTTTSPYWPALIPTVHPHAHGDNGLEFSGNF